MQVTIDTEKITDEKLRRLLNEVVRLNRFDRGCETVPRHPGSISVSFAHCDSDEAAAAAELTNIVRKKVAALLDEARLAIVADLEREALRCSIEEPIVEE